MAWRKKAQATDVFWFGFFYFPLLVGLVLALVIMPTELMEGSVQPVPLDQAVHARQLHARLWETNPATGRTSPFEYTDNLAKINESTTKKQMTYSVAMDADEAIYRKSFYDIAKPIAPFRYQGYREASIVEVDGRKKLLKIESYYPQRYELKPK